MATPNNPKNVKADELTFTPSEIGDWRRGIAGETLRSWKKVPKKKKRRTKTKSKAKSKAKERVKRGAKPEPKKDPKPEIQHISKRPLVKWKATNVKYNDKLLMIFWLTENINPIVSALRPVVHMKEADMPLGIVWKLPQLQDYKCNSTKAFLVDFFLREIKWAKKTFLKSAQHREPKRFKKGAKLAAEIRKELKMSSAEKKATRRWFGGEDKKGKKKKKSKSKSKKGRSKKPKAELKGILVEKVPEPQAKTVVLVSFGTGFGVYRKLSIFQPPIETKPSKKPPTKPPPKPAAKPEPAPPPPAKTLDPKTANTLQKPTPTSPASKPIKNPKSKQAQPPPPPPPIEIKPEPEVPILRPKYDLITISLITSCRAIRFLLDAQFVYPENESLTARYVTSFIKEVFLCANLDTKLFDAALARMVDHCFSTFIAYRNLFGAFIANDLPELTDQKHIRIKIINSAKILPLSEAILVDEAFCVRKISYKKTAEKKGDGDASAATAATGKNQADKVVKKAIAKEFYKSRLRRKKKQKKQEVKKGGKSAKRKTPKKTPK